MGVFFFQAEDGIRDTSVTGVQTCALPIFSPTYLNLIEKGRRTAQLPLLWKALEIFGVEVEPFMASLGEERLDEGRSEERRVGKEGRAGGGPAHAGKKTRDAEDKRQSAAQR